MKFSVTDNPNW